MMNNVNVCAWQTSFGALLSYDRHKNRTILNERNISIVINRRKHLLYTFGCDLALLVDPYNKQFRKFLEI